MKHIKLIICLVIFLLVLCACESDRPFETLTYPEIVYFDMYHSSLTARSDDADAIRDFVDMLNECRYQEIETDKEPYEVLALPYISIESNTVEFYLDPDTAKIYLFDFNTERTLTKTYQLKGFDKAVFEAIYRADPQKPSSEAVKAFVTMLRGCTYEEIVFDKTSSEIAGFTTIIPPLSTHTIHLDADTARIYLYATENDLAYNKAYQLKGFDKASFDAVYHPEHAEN